VARPVHGAARKAGDETRLPPPGLPALCYGDERAKHFLETHLRQYFQ